MSFKFMSIGVHGNKPLLFRQWLVREQALIGGFHQGEGGLGVWGGGGGGGGGGNHA